MKEHVSSSAATSINAHCNQIYSKHTEKDAGMGLEALAHKSHNPNTYTLASVTTALP